MFSRALLIFPDLLDSFQLGSLQFKYVFLEVLDHIALSHHLLGNQESFPLPTSLHSLFLHLSQSQQKARGPQQLPLLVTQPVLHSPFLQLRAAYCTCPC